MTKSITMVEWDTTEWCVKDFNLSWLMWFLWEYEQEISSGAPWSLEGIYISALLYFRTKTWGNGRRIVPMGQVMRRTTSAANLKMDAHITFQI